VIAGDKREGVKEILHRKERRSEKRVKTKQNKTEWHQHQENPAGRFSLSYQSVRCYSSDLQAGVGKEKYIYSLWLSPFISGAGIIPGISDQ
jgi:hypothetical protein